MARQAVLEAPGRTEDDVLPPDPPEMEEGGRRHRALTASVAVAVALLIGLAAGAAWARAHEHRVPPAPVALGPLLTVDPPDGTAGVRPDAKVTVQANRGRLSELAAVDDAGHPLAGALAPDGRSWQSAAVLPFDTHYRLTAHLAGVRKRRLVVRTSSFSTVHPAGLLKPTITPGDNQTVGVGAPIVLRFKAPVANKAAVLQAITVTMSTPVPAAWRWFGPRELHYRPQQYWPTGEKVSMTAKLANLDAGNNIWGEADHAVSFSVGDAHVSTVDINAHTMTVTTNGATLKTVPISAGRTKYPTMGGVHIVLERSYDVVMDSQTVGIPRGSPDGYYEHVYWDVAISTGGEYVHAAPWSTGAQGNSNVSHGCVNLSTGDAKWFYGFSLPGDIVQVVGSPRGPSDDAGVVDWKIPWEQWGQPA